MRFLNIAAGLGISALSIYGLVLGKGILIPLLIAIVLSYIIVSLANKYQEILCVHCKWKIPYLVYLFAGILTCLVAFYFAYTIVNNNVNNVVKEAPVYQQKFAYLITDIQKQFPNIKSVAIDQLSAKINIPAIVSGLTNMLTSFAGSTSMIIVYLFFILLELRKYPQKLQALVPGSSKRKKFIDLMTEIDKDIKTYFSIKTLMSMITAVLSYIVMLLVGVNFASFWAFIIFILNYIPTIGSIIAVIFPIVLTLIQFESGIPFVVVGISLVSIQFTIGNIVEPRFLGKSLNLSPLVIIISLMIMGNIWGVTGMFLSVPILGVLNIVMAKFPQTRAVAIILSSEGNIK